MPGNSEHRRILVVDDEERMVRFIRMNLEHDGFQVSDANNGKQAISKLALIEVLEGEEESKIIGFVRE